MPACRSQTCWASHNLLAHLDLRPLTEEVGCLPCLLVWVFVFTFPLLISVWFLLANISLVLKGCLSGFVPDVEANTGESETERWARERNERRQIRARRKAQRTGEVNSAY